MIKINGIKYTPKHFPDGTQCLNDFPITNFDKEENTIFWNYESDEEVLTLIYIINHIRNTFCRKAKISLYMPYIPNARMDRTKHDTEVFTLKYFADIINSLNFDKVYVLDAHSDVSLALLNNLVLIPVNYYISKVVNEITKLYVHDLVIYFPDNGAYKRYKDLECLSNFTKIYGKKIRNWETGKIEGLKIVDENDERLDLIHAKPLEGKIILMIDDIISYGGTFYYSALELNKLGAIDIQAYATHVEPNSLYNEEKGLFYKLLENKTVTKLFTTDSIYNKPSNFNIEVYKV